MRCEGIRETSELLLLQIENGDWMTLTISPNSMFDCRTSSPIPTVIYHGRDAGSGRESARMCGRGIGGRNAESAERGKYS